METSPAVPPELAALRAEAEAQGFVWGMDFAIAFMPAQLSSELILFGMDDDEYVVRYSDMGTKRVLFRSADFAAARETFLDEVAWLAAPRGRGPYVGRKSRAEALAERPMDQIVADFMKRHGGGPASGA